MVTVAVSASLTAEEFCHQLRELANSALAPAAVAHATGWCYRPHELAPSSGVTPSINTVKGRVDSISPRLTQAG